MHNHALLALLPVLALCFCSSDRSTGRIAGRIISPAATSGGQERSVAGSPGGADPVVEFLGASKENSRHLILLRSREQPHVHDRHDLVGFVLSGKSRVHFPGRSVEANAGDVVEIPRGVPHWAENTGPGVLSLYAIFSPPFDGKDRRAVPHLRTGAGP